MSQYNLNLSFAANIAPQNGLSEYEQLYFEELQLGSKELIALIYLCQQNQMFEHAQFLKENITITPAMTQIYHIVYLFQNEQYESFMDIMPHFNQSKLQYEIQNAFQKWLHNGQFHDMVDQTIPNAWQHELDNDITYSNIYIDTLLQIDSLSDWYGLLVAYSMDTKSFLYVDKNQTKFKVTSRDRILSSLKMIYTRKYRDRIDGLIMDYRDVDLQNEIYPDLVNLMQQLPRHQVMSVHCSTTQRIFLQKLN